MSRVIEELEKSLFPQGNQVKKEPPVLVPKKSDKSFFIKEAWGHLKGKPVGTIAVVDYTVDALKSNKVYIRDLVPSILAYLMRDTEPDMVKNFLLKTLHVEGWERQSMANFKLEEAMMPAIFKVEYDTNLEQHVLVAELGQGAVGCVTPLDNSYWWAILLRAYIEYTQDSELLENPQIQNHLNGIINQSLSDGLESLLLRKHTKWGFQTQVLQFFFLKVARQMMKIDDFELVERMDQMSIKLTHYTKKKSKDFNHQMQLQIALPMSGWSGVLHTVPLSGIWILAFANAGVDTGDPSKRNLKAGTGAHLVTCHIEYTKMDEILCRIKEKLNYAKEIGILYSTSKLRDVNEAELEGVFNILRTAKDENLMRQFRAQHMLVLSNNEPNVNLINSRVPAISSRSIEAQKLVRGIASLRNSLGFSLGCVSSEVNKVAKSAALCGKCSKRPTFLKPAQYTEKFINLVKLFGRIPC